jgi:hypothetical protein
MKIQTAVRSLCLAGVLFGGIAAWGQTLPLAPHRDSGDSVIGVFEGWFKNADGTFIEIGYYNRNLKEELDIPVGPNNKIEPGGPDYGQPTHFYPNKAWGINVIKVPNDFADKQLQWTLTANGKTTVIPLNLKTDWELAPFQDAEGDLPPYVSFSPLAKKARTVIGPIPVTMEAKVKVGEELPLTVYVADDAKVQPGQRTPKVPVTLHWTIYRQAGGTVKFSQSRPVVEKTDDLMPPSAVFTGKATTTATFSEPGDYILEVVANDATGEGGGGFMCCWTNGVVKVKVEPKVQNTTGGA